jgi:hypothetical protein
MRQQQDEDQLHAKNTKTIEFILANYQKTVRSLCSENIPQNISDVFHVVPKVRGEFSCADGTCLNVMMTDMDTRYDWKHTRESAAQAMLGYHKLDPYKAPLDFKYDFSHLQVPSLLAAVSETTAMWPARFGELKGTQLFIDDYLVSSAKGLLRLMGAPRSVEPINAEGPHYSSITYDG